MKAIKTLFRFNGRKGLLPQTMEAAIEQARTMAIEDRETCRLEGQASNGTWVLLGNYIPHPDGFIRRIDRDGVETLPPCCIAKPEIAPAL